MMRAQFVGGTHVEQLTRATALAEVAGILDEGVPGRGQYEAN